MAARVRCMGNGKGKPNAATKTFSRTAISVSASSVPYIVIIIRSHISFAIYAMRHIVSPTIAVEYARQCANPRFSTWRVSSPGKGVLRHLVNSRVELDHAAAADVLAPLHHILLEPRHRKRILAQCVVARKPRPCRVAVRNRAQSVAMSATSRGRTACKCAPRERGDTRDPAAAPAGSASF